MATSKLLWITDHCVPHIHQRHGWIKCTDNEHSLQIHELPYISHLPLQLSCGLVKTTYAPRKMWAKMANHFKTKTINNWSVSPFPLFPCFCNLEKCMVIWQHFTRQRDPGFLATWWRIDSVDTHYTLNKSGMNFVLLINWNKAYLKLS